MERNYSQMNSTISSVETHRKRLDLNVLCTNCFKFGLATQPNGEFIYSPGGFTREGPKGETVH